VICLWMGDSPWKHGVIPHEAFSVKAGGERCNCTVWG
jgi:hypothetical protein